MSSALLVEEARLVGRTIGGQVDDLESTDVWPILGNGLSDIHLNAPGNAVEFAISSDNISKLFLLNGAGDTLALASLNSKTMFYMDGPNDRIGISDVGLLPKSGKLNIRSGDTTLIANSNADAIVVEGLGNIGASFLGADTSIFSLFVGGPTNGVIDGVFQYNITAQTWVMNVDNSDEIMRGSKGIGVVFNELGLAAHDLRAESSFSAHGLFLNAGTGTVHVANSVTTGAGFGSLVLGNGAFLRFLNNTSSSSANFGITGNAANNLNFNVPANSGLQAFNWAGIPLAWFQYGNGGAGLVYLTESSADQNPPGANGLVLYTKDDGAGNTQYMARFNTGDPQVLASEAGSQSGSMVLLSEQDASSSATIDFEDFFASSAYKSYVIQGRNITHAADDVVGWLRIKESGTWQAGTAYEWGMYGSIASGSAASDGSNSDSAIIIGLTSGTDSWGNAAGESYNFDVDVGDISGSTLRKVFGIRCWGITAAPQVGNFITAGWYKTNTNEITGIRFLSESGNITSGTFKLYGIK